jgi:HK97 family phage major capsid protein
MPSEGAEPYPVAYGDFRRAYVLVDRIQMALLRDPYTQATERQHPLHHAQASRRPGRARRSDPQAEVLDLIAARF